MPIVVGLAVIAYKMLHCVFYYRSMIHKNIQKLKYHNPNLSKIMSLSYVLESFCTINVQILEYYILLEVGAFEI